MARYDNDQNNFIPPSSRIVVFYDHLRLKKHPILILIVVDIQRATALSKLTDVIEKLMEKEKLVSL